MRTVFVCVAALVLPACLAPLAAFDRSKLVAEERSWWWGDKYTQDGGRIGLHEVMSALESEEAARPHVERWRRYHHAAPATLIPGAASMGFGYAELSRDGGNGAVGWILLGAGVGLVVTSQVLGDAARSAAHDAVAAHNGLIGGAARSSTGTCELRGPWIVALPDARGRPARGAGIAVTF